MSDADVRLRALDPSRSVLLQAPAGSGKTTVLALRFLTLLAVVDEPEEILAITFTRKAAAEMRDRVQRALRGELDASSPTAAQWSALRDRVLVHAQRRGWDLGELPLRLRIQTIDSLNQYLATQLPLLDAGPGQWQVTDNARPLHERAARRTLLDAERDPALRDAMGMIFERLDNRWDRAEQLLADLLAKRAQWLPQILGTPPELLSERVGASLRAIAAEALQRTSSCIAAHFRKEAHELAYAAAQQRVALQLPSGDWQVWLTPPPHLGEDPEHLTHWQVLANMSLTEKGTWRMSLNRNHGFPPSEKALKQRFGNLLADLAQMTGARECLLNLRDLPPLQMLTEDADALAGLARILQLAAAELQLVFTATGRVDHTLVAASAREALGESDAPSELAMRFGTALRHLLVDEFQDTSIEQFALIEALVGGWQANDGRSLFLVGDPMQSIYQFRAAEVGLFLRARARGIGALQLESLALTRNFRSLPVVTNWVNAAFAQLLPASDDLRSSAVQFLAADAAGSGAPPGEVTVHALDSADAGSEAQRVLGIVRQARARDAGASMAILVASRRHAAVIAATLRAAGVPVRGIDLEPLATRPAVRDLTALTRALLRPADRSSWLAVLRAPWCGLSLVDLTALCASDALITELLREQERVATLSETGSRNLRRCAPLLLEAVECRGRTELAALVESTWLRLGGPATCNPAALRDAEGFFIALYAQEIDGTLDEGSLDLLTDALFTQGEGDAAGAVEVLTIHRAKGLEWDVVILPGLGHRMQSDASPLLRWIELPRGDSGTDLLMATLSLGNPDASDPLNEYIKGLQKQRLANEKVRLAYVAATRARRELHLLGHAPLDARTDLPAPPASSLLRVLWPAIETQYVPGAGNAAVATAPTRLQQFLYRLPPDWQSPPLPSDVGVIALPLTQEEAEITEYSWVGLTARAIGTVVHAELEALAHEDTWPPAGFANRRERHETSLRQLGVEASARPAAIVRIEAALRKTLADKRAAWIFSPAHRERAAELRLSGMVDDRLVNISIDRTFIDERGTRWVIDFKTSTHEGADLQGFLAQETERYQPQLQRYAQLARHLGPEPVRAAIYFPLLGEFREI